MTVIEPGPITGRAGLVERVKGILLHPKTEWERIDGEPATVQSLYTGYICILAAIPAIAGLIGGSLIGAGFGIHLSIAYLIVQAVLGYIASLLVVALVAVIINALAPSFGGVKNTVQAFKVAAYSFTAAWVAGIVTIIPMLGILVFVAMLYGFYIMYLGLGRLMKSPEDKTLGYFMVTVLVTIVAYAIIAWICFTILATTMGAAAMGAWGMTHHASVTPAVVSIGGQTVDTGRLQAAANQMQAAANGQTASGATIKAVAPETLKGLLPGGLDGGYSRSEVSANGVAAGGFGGTSAEARYAKGESAITLDVTDMAAVGALASLGSSMGVSSSRETATGYEKVGTINGRLTTEEYDNQAHTGKYSVVVGQRFMVAASGQQVSMDDLKHAVAVVDSGKLESWAKA